MNAQMSSYGTILEQFLEQFLENDNWTERTRELSKRLSTCLQRGTLVYDSTYPPDIIPISDVYHTTIIRVSSRKGHVNSSSIRRRRPLRPLCLPSELVWFCAFSELLGSSPAASASVDWNIFHTVVVQRV
jgi:hypothetical protein